MKGFNENEVSVKSSGGTELSKRTLAKYLDEKLLENFQIIPSRIRELKEDKIRILWLHDLPNDPESIKLKEKSFRDKFHKFVFSSNWQYQQFQNYLGFPYDDKSIVIETGIEPSKSENLNKDADTVHLVYLSTPQRGLEILLPVFEKLCEIHNNIHLHVYSSFKIYGWDDYDKNFNHLYDICKNNEKITYHGFTDNETLRKNLDTYHILAYPSIWQETSCRALIESMSAGLICVHPNFGALPDTSGGLTFMYQGSEDKATHANMFATYLDLAIRNANQENMKPMLAFNKIYADGRFGLSNVSLKWDSLLKGLLNKFPPEKRKLEKQIFTYKVNV